MVGCDRVGRLRQRQAEEALRELIRQDMTELQLRPEGQQVAECCRVLCGRGRVASLFSASPCQDHYLVIPWFFSLSVCIAIFCYSFSSFALYLFFKVYYLFKPHLWDYIGYVIVVLRKLWGRAGCGIMDNSKDLFIFYPLPVTSLQHYPRLNLSLKSLYPQLFLSPKSIYNSHKIE